MTGAEASKPWSVRVRRDDVPEAGLHLDIAADEATRAAVAALAGASAVPRLAASFDVTRQGKGLRVAGEVVATVGQTCVVSLEPMTSELREPVDVVFLPPGERVPEPADIDPETVDETEPLVDGSADLGATATEFLLLAIDPYPRKPGAVFAAPRTAEPDPNPFAALAVLKKPPTET
jgi:uncharacterized metal-binding protein YceD (DUF177 family)